VFLFFINYLEKQKNSLIRKTIYFIKLTIGMPTDMTNLKQPIMLTLGDTRPMLGSDKFKLVIVFCKLPKVTNAASSYL